METLYRIVFNGETLSGLTAEQIIEAFVTRFLVREQRARKIVLGGRHTVLKRGLDQVKAQRYSSALKKIGLLIVLKPQSPVTEPPLSVELNPSIDLSHSEMASYYDTPASKPVSAPASGPCRRLVALSQVPTARGFPCHGGLPVVRADGGALSRPARRTGERDGRGQWRQPLCPAGGGLDPTRDRLERRGTAPTPAGICRPGLGLGAGGLGAL